MGSPSRFLTVFSVLILSAAMSGCDSPAQRQQKMPNIILIMADDLGREAIGAYGCDEYSTPNIDRMAAEGALFTYAYSMPLCTPTRVQLMTGKYNFRNYIGFGLLDSSQHTFGNLLKEAGYKTCIAGKWQLRGNERQRKLAGGRIGSWPEGAGFDEYCLWQIDERGSRYKDPMVTMTGRKTSVFHGKYGPDIFVEFIEKFIDEHEKEPFFIYYPMVLTHDPFVPTPADPDFSDDEKHTRSDTTYFASMVHYADSFVGRILQKIDEKGLNDNTLVIFTGDNGTHRSVITEFRGRPFRGDKGQPTDAGTHVPLVMQWPGHLKAGTVSNALIDFTDFLPTFTDVAGAKLPAGFQTDGMSFYPLLEGKEFEGRDWIFCHYDPNWGGRKKARYVQNRELKLYEDGRIYNVEKDPLETELLEKRLLTERQRQIIEEFRVVLQKMQ